MVAAGGEHKVGLESDSTVVAAGPEVELAKWNLIEAVTWYKLTISSTTGKSVTRPGGCHSKPKAKNRASVIGRHFICHSGREGSRNRLVGVGFSGTGGSGQRGGETEVQSIPEGEIAH